ncbi:MAG TPA: G1 family glutamic endopeptidase [Stellaceae bacterium]|nr:G1 family glutamic endopeptidase [Stellaceae bacterium]
MKTVLARPARATSFACMVAAVTLPTLSSATAGEKPGLSPLKGSEMSFAPAQIQLNPDGSVMRGPRSAIVTKNWAGYIIRYVQTGELYTSVSASWMIPTVIYYFHDPSFALEASSIWVGIGAACLDNSYLTQATCDNKDHSLIQVVTAQQATPTGTTYVAKYEMLPNPAVTIPITVNPGDRVTGSVRCVADCSSATQTWALALTNETTGAVWGPQNFAYASRESSAEWIEEAPSASAGILPLADFDVASVGVQMEANGKTPMLTLQDNGMIMMNPWGQWAKPSQSDPGQSGLFAFGVCWYDSAPGSIPCLSP